jgi:hypothetical protein
MKQIETDNANPNFDRRRFEVKLTTDELNAIVDSITESVEANNGWIANSQKWAFHTVARVIIANDIWDSESQLTFIRQMLVKYPLE